MKQGDDNWLKERERHAITWSNAGTVCGVGYETRQLYMKRKLKLVPEKPLNWAMSEGIKREPYAAELYYRIMHFCGYNIRFIMDAFKEDPQDKRIGGSVDRIVEDLDSGEKWILEIKTNPGKEMRTAVPITHNLQMHGLCHTYGLNKAHYFCWSSGQGSYLAEVTWEPVLWHRVYEWYAEFADQWERQEIPKGLKGTEKEARAEFIWRHTNVGEVANVLEKRLLRAQQEMQEAHIDSY